jgi:hypothetical protein
MWTILKNLLFSIVMFADVCLTAFLYIPGHIALIPFSSSTDSPASFLAQTTLRAFSHLSFVISQFGGVTSSSEHGFTELNRAFYLALDILSTNHIASEAFTRQWCEFFSGPGSLFSNPVSASS